MKLSLIRTLTAFALMIAAIGCSGSDSSGPSALTPQITIAGDTLHPGDILLVTVSGMHTTGEPITATLADVPFEMTPLADSAYAAFVPNTAEGPKTLVVPFEDTTVVVVVQIMTVLDIADPAAMVDSIFDEYLAGLSAVAPEGVDSATWAAETAELDSLLVEAKADLAALTPTERLILARLLSPPPGGTGVAPFATASAGDTLCAKVETDALDAIYYGAKGIGAWMLAGPVGLFSDALKEQLGVVARVSLRRVVGTQYVRNKTCKVPAKLTGVAGGIRGAPAVDGAAPGAMAVGPDRFLKGYRMKFSYTGELRPVSRDDLSRDPVLAKVDGAYRGVLGLVKDNFSIFPAWLQGEIALLPKSIAETPSGPSAPGEIRPEELTIANVSPASVSLTTGVDGDNFTLTSSNTVTNDVNFTYDVVVAANPSIKFKKSGVLRPPMTMTWQDIGHTFTGDRTQEMVGDVVYGKLSCAGSMNLVVKGGDKGTWEEFHWLQVAWNEGEVSDTTSMGHAEFDEGNVPFNGSWYYRYNDGTGPVYKAFTIYFRAKYIDQVTGEAQETPIYSFTCN